jgi:hypothetical protein
MPFAGEPKLLPDGLRLPTTFILSIFLVEPAQDANPHHTPKKLFAVL